MPPQRARHLVLVLGDQLDRDSAALEDLDPERDIVLMAEVEEESTKVPSHRARIALFLAAMRHFRDDLQERGVPVDYVELDARGNTGTLPGELRRAIRRHRPERVVMVRAGEWSVHESLLEAAAAGGVDVEVRPDGHFLESVEGFAEWAEGRKSLRMEHFYRAMRREHEVLLDGGKPAGGAWNFDERNRESFGKDGPAGLPRVRSFRPDDTTDEVIRLVAKRFPDHPGSLESFRWPVTRREALAALRDFVKKRLPRFGPHQDAMWTGEPFLSHSLVASSLNLKLLDPREVIEKAEAAYRSGDAPIASVEGFVRQVLGWREFIRGIYWTEMPGYIDGNALRAEASLPGFYWSAETDMACLAEVVGQTLRHGYSHHIQRLMVTGLFALLLGVRPREVHEWYLAMYVDAVEWVELPNTLGMSQFADGGRMSSKPYAATGKYIRRMSNFCDGCRYDPDAATGDDACPFTTLYWDFLMRNEKRLGKNPRMGLQVKNLGRKAAAERRAIRRRAEEVRGACGG